MHLLTCCANLSAPGSDTQHSQSAEQRLVWLCPLGALRMHQLPLLLKPGPTCLPQALGLPGALVMCSPSQDAAEGSGVSFRPFIHPEHPSKLRARALRYNVV